MEQKKKLGADSMVPPGSVLPAFAPTKARLGETAGSTACRSSTGGLEEPACTKLMGNCSGWLLPSPGAGAGEGGGVGVEVHEMGGSTE